MAFQAMQCFYLHGVLNEVSVGVRMTVRLLGLPSFFK